MMLLRKKLEPLELLELKMIKGRSDWLYHRIGELLGIEGSSRSKWKGMGPGGLYNNGERRNLNRNLVISELISFSNPLSFD